MKMSGFPFSTTDWSQIAPAPHSGDTGVARWRTQNFGDIRVRMVEYSPGYVADHWCSKGHIILCLDGEFETEVKGGQTYALRAGMTYQVADGDPPHRTSTRTGAKLFIVD